MKFRKPHPEADATPGRPAGSRSGKGSRRAPRSANRWRYRGGNIVTAGPAIATAGLSYTYPGAETDALSGVTFSVAPGEFVYLVGASGSGKSTLLRLMYAEARGFTGRLRVAGVNVARLKAKTLPAYRRRLGVVFQDFKLLEGRTVYDQVAFALTVIGRRKDAPTRVPQILDLVGLADYADRLPTELSGGEQQRVAIARALATDPLVLIADEPTGNLDPETSKTVMDVLARINAAGTAVLMATHDANLVDRTGHRVLVLNNGRLVRDDVTGGYESSQLPVITVSYASKEEQ